MMMNSEMTTQTMVTMMDPYPKKKLCQPDLAPTEESLIMLMPWSILASEEHLTRPQTLQTTTMESEMKTQMRSTGVSGMVINMISVEKVSHILAEAVMKERAAKNLSQTQLAKLAN